MRIKHGSFELNIEISGNDDGETVLMAHSLGCNLSMWDPQMPVLEPHYRVVRLDMRGHGKSDVPPGPYTLDALADDVITVMDELDIAKANWVGLSVGGMIGQSLLLRYSDRFRAAALCDTASTQPANAIPMWEERIKTVETGGVEAIVDATMLRWFTQDFLNSEHPGIDKVRRQLASTPSAGYAACSRAIMALDYIDQLEKIDVPILLMVGADDIATPVSGSEAMHSRLPHSELHILDKAAHIANVEQADKFNEKLLSFLQSV